MKDSQLTDCWSSCDVVAVTVVTVAVTVDVTVAVTDCWSSFYC